MLSPVFREVIANLPDYKLQRILDTPLALWDYAVFVQPSTGARCFLGVVDDLQKHKVVSTIVLDPTPELWVPFRYSDITPAGCITALGQKIAREFDSLSREHRLTTVVTAIKALAQEVLDSRSAVETLIEESEVAHVG